jgi:Tfp pilus assembly protein PilN
MALHLNLFHEIEKRKALDRRDPLKLSMYGIGLVALGLAGYYGVQFAKANSTSSELARVQDEYRKLTPQAEAAKKKEADLGVAIKTSEALVKRIEGRFYWASVLESLSEIVPPQVQITKLNGEMQTDAARHGVITLEGVSAGSEPRKVAEDLRRALNEKFGAKYKKVTTTFHGLDDGKDTVMLHGAAAPTAIFTIKIALQLLEDEAPPPPPKGKKAAAAPAAALL